MKTDKRVLKEMQDLDQIMNKRLVMEKKLHQTTLQSLTKQKQAKRTEFSF